MLQDHLNGWARDSIGDDGGETPRTRITDKDRWHTVKKNPRVAQYFRIATRRTDNVALIVCKIIRYEMFSDNGHQFAGRDAWELTDRIEHGDHSGRRWRRQRQVNPETRTTGWRGRSGDKTHGISEQDGPEFVK